MNTETIHYFCDAAIGSLGQSSGVAVIVRNAAGQILDAASCCLEGMTNNEAEYEALILGLELALARSDQSATFLTDSQIVVGQGAQRLAQVAQQRPVLCPADNTPVGDGAFHVQRRRPQALAEGDGAGDCIGIGVVVDPDQGLIYVIQCYARFKGHVPNSAN